MRRALCLSMLLFFGLMIPLSSTIPSLKAAYLPNGEGFLLASGINITSPISKIYNSDEPLLNISLSSMAGTYIYKYKIVYSLDGETNVTLPVKSTFVPVEATINYPNGTTEKGISSIFSYFIISSCIELKNLPQGSHNLTVYARHERINNTSGNWPALLLDNETVNFVINNRIAPSISNLSIENKTFNQNAPVLNFTLDNPVEWIGYSLDQKANITITGNTTLPRLLAGSHSIVIFANDSLGNMGSSDNIKFNIAQESTIQSSEVGFVTVVVIIGVVTVIAIILKKQILIQKGK